MVAAPPHLLVARETHEPRIWALDHEGGQSSLEGSRSIGDCQHDDVVTGFDVRDELLRAIEPPASVDFHCLGADAAEIRPGIRFGEGVRHCRTAGQQLRKNAAALFLVEMCERK